METARRVSKDEKVNWLAINRVKENWYSMACHGTIKTDEPRTLDFSGVRGFLVTNMFIVQCSVTYNVHSLEPYRISSTAAFSSSKVL